MPVTNARQPADCTESGRRTYPSQGHHFPLFFAVYQVVEGLHGDERCPAMPFRDMLCFLELPDPHCRNPDVEGLARQSAAVGATPHDAMHLGGDDNLVPPGKILDGASQNFLASAEAYRIPVVLVFNKTDLLTEDEMHYQDMMTLLYENIGYKCVTLSALNDDVTDTLRPILEGKITLFSGNSGVGKSTLLNRLIPGINLRTAEISDAHNTGMHTTTFSEMLPLPYGGWVIDTPGIKGFGTFDMEPEEICGYFKEIFMFSKDCRFSNCTHTHEPGCAVRKALEEHYISESRYNSYLSMLKDKEEGKYREAW